MIKFFRKIRQKLISENKFSKYLIYAIGEIVLVVIGILIALQVNNLNANKNLINKTLVSLGSLAEELNSNKKVLQANIDILKFDIGTGLNLIDSLNNNSVPKENRNTFLLDKILDLGPLRLRSLTTNSLEEMISSGSYSAINSETIKENLLAYNSEIENMNYELQRFEEYWRTIESPYIAKHFSLLDMYTRRVDSLIKEDAMLIGANVPTFNKQEVYFENDLTAFYNNREFASMYMSRFFDLRAVLRAMYRLDASIDDLLANITNLN